MDGGSGALESLVTASPFWRGKRVLLTGHTGFKGAWLALVLERLGANVIAGSLPPATDPNLWQLVEKRLTCESHWLDIRDEAAVAKLVAQAQPDIVLHLAARSLVRDAYAFPVDAFATNIMGTVNLLNALRSAKGLAAVLVVTSDKVYENVEDDKAFAETDRLGGHDPYSASKAACEIAVASFDASFYRPAKIPLATVRGGNVVGGGDWAADRIIPDLWRAARTRQPVSLRHPGATRPWQHVLDCLYAYLLFAEALATKPAGALPSSLNIGPNVDDAAVPVAEVAERIGHELGMKPAWQPADGVHPPEKQRLRIDNRVAKKTLGWSPRLTTDQTLTWTADWYRAFDAGEDPYAITMAQVDRFLSA